MFNVHKTTIIILISFAILSLGFFAVAGESSSSSGLSAKTLNNATQCWQFENSNSCTFSGNGTCIWNSDQWGSWCASATCYDGDHTNYTYCQATLRESYNLSCGWQIHGTNLCDPNGTTSSFFGQGCSDYSGNQQGCYNTFFCQWNSSNNGCLDPAGFVDNYIPVQGPGCGAIIDQPTCKNITDCSWNAGSSTCGGLQSGIQCNNLNKTICSDFTMLSTCCNWNGTTCKSTFDSGCYNSMSALPVGKTFCEDYLTYDNQANCNEIAGPPWYMPCKWDNNSDECHFNSVSFGGSASFDEMGTKVGCEAQNGVWKTQQFTSGGVTQTDSWCEFKFGFEYSGGGNCDSACWSCEAGVSTVKGNTTAQAEDFCEDSALGFCDFNSDSNAPNGLGWCNPKSEFVQGGGKSCGDECSACDYTMNPQSQCLNNTDCVWATDVNAPNKAGFCYGKNEKRCENDCWSCYTFNDCAVNGDGGNGACVWDSVNSFCKPSGYTGEVCFDGKDNDADSSVDCADSECSTDKFCGGDDLDIGFGVNCPSFSSNDSCAQNGCVWLVDNFDANFGSGNSSLIGFCDFPGAQCWQHDDNSSGCNATSGCGWLVQSGGFCEENSTLFDSCFPINTLPTCLSVPGCDWTTDPFGSGSRCEPLVFSQCFGNSTRRLNQTNCEQNETHSGESTQICSWSADPYGPNGGFCDPVCFGLSASTCNAKSSGLCEVVTGLCDPTSFSGNCYGADGNQTKCIKDFNSTCSWFTDVAANNNVSNKSSNGDPDAAMTKSGWCDPKGTGSFVEFMGTIEPVIIGIDEIEAINMSYNILGVGLRDEFDKIIFGTKTSDSFASSSACNNVPTYITGAVGVGVLNYTFHWYVDADGNSSNNCAARDNSSLAGFEFMFKYQSRWVTSLTEVQTASRCVNGSWGVAPIPLISNKQVMCDVVGGGMAGIGKNELSKFKGLYNKSKDLRIYATVSNITINDSKITDAAGPFFYTQGSVDSTFEDCTNSGADSDGDGLTANNDPDCQMFLKFGYTPVESGFMCGDGKDNDGDGSADCADAGCTYDFVCGGSGISEADPNDKTAPKIIWMKADTYPDSAFIMYDTDEPSNGTVLFYNNDSSCKTINKTIRDAGLFDDLVSAYKLWHDGPIDGYANNIDAIDNTVLKNSTTFFYKTKVCDINSNCAVSACLNFSTKKIIGDCKGCKSTLNFPFTPPPGNLADEVTDPIGNLHFVVEKSDGTNLTLGANAAAGVQLNYTDAKNFNLLLENPDVASSSMWRFRLLNASITGKIAASVLNFTGGTDLQFNATTNGSYVGLDATKCQEMLNYFRPKKLEIGIPGNYTTELWQCAKGLENCTNKASNATSLGYNSALDMSLWIVPAGWGC